jgi:multiple sugar transport system ATP-binding protein
MNLVDAEMRSQDGRLTLAALDEHGKAAFDVALSPSALSPSVLPPSFERMLAAGRKIVLGFRPQAASLALATGTRAGGGPLTIRGSVISNEWLGDQSHIGIEAGGIFLIAVTDGRSAMPEDGAVSLTLRPDTLHVFDRETGQALLHGGTIAETARHAA